MVTIVTSFVIMILLFAILSNVLTISKANDKLTRIGTGLALVLNVLVVVAVLYLAAV